MTYPTAAFDYDLPPDRVAQRPLGRRDDSRLLVLDRKSGSIRHCQFRDLAELVPAGDALVLNESRVFPARLVGRKPTGAPAEILLLRPIPEHRSPCNVPVRPTRNPRSAGIGPKHSAPGSTERADGAGPGSADATGGTGPGSAAPGADSRSSRASASAARAHTGSSEPAEPTGRGAGTDSRLWEALVRPGGKLKPGRVVDIAEALQVEIVDSTPNNGRIVRLHTSLRVDEALARFGRVPLPPYIQRDAGPEDADRYQTVYARARGSVAAPTAGLHFMPALLARLEARDVRLARLVLHVGVGTFRPVEAADPAEHRMHAEEYTVSACAAETLNETRAQGGKIWAVGTTVTRTLETVTKDGIVRPGTGWTDLFIRHPYRFRAVDQLITNFHLPRSTLLMLVSAFGGHEPVMRAYREAVACSYRFYSYGDAMAVI